MIAYAKRVGWLIFWAAVVILGLLVVPVMHNTSAIPMVVFAIIVLAVFSALWGTGMLGRQLAMWGAAIALTLSMLSFFLPLTAKRVPEKVKAFDVWLASTPTPTPLPAAHPPALIATQQQKVGPTPTLHPFEVTGCYETNLGYETRWSPNKGSMRVHDPFGGSHVETLGKKSPVSAFGPGHWGFCEEGPDPATGAVIWE